MNNQKTKQSGFIVLMGMLALVVGAGIWFGTLGNLRSNTMSIQQNDSGINQLKRIKEKMLTYAVLYPELNEDNDAIVDEPGVGYFPCPDENGDGESQTTVAPFTCGRDALVNDELFVLGMVPHKISSRFFSFLDTSLDSHLFWYAVDARFLSFNMLFADTTADLYAPLNVNTSSLVKDRLNNDVAPFTVDGQDEIVMVLFYAGKPLEGQSRPSIDPADYLEQNIIYNASGVSTTDTGTLITGLTHDFTTSGNDPDTFNDYVITITRAEWKAAVLSRVSQDLMNVNLGPGSPPDGVPDLCDSVSTGVQHWFNECSYDTTSPNFNNAPFPSGLCSSTVVTPNENISGQNWRSIICP